LTSVFACIAIGLHDFPYFIFHTVQATYQET